VLVVAHGDFGGGNDGGHRESEDCSLHQK
jgi:hypothetical protein